MKKSIVLLAVFILLSVMFSCNDDANEPAPDAPSVTDTSTVENTTTSEKTDITVSAIPVPKLVLQEGADPSELPTVEGYDNYAAGGQFTYNFSASEAFVNESAAMAYNELVLYILSLNKSYDISFTYYNLETRCRLDYRSDTTYDTCSVIKAPFALYLLQSGVDLDEMIPCSNYIGGSGILKRADVGKKYSVRDYITYSIKYSDNCAYMTLLDHFGRDGFTEYLKESGNVNTRLINCSFGWMSASDAAIAMRDIYEAKDTDYGKFLVDLMSNTEFNELISGAVLPWQIAHKFGDDEIRICLHDAAIIFADHPYVLTIFSHMNENTEMDRACEVFREITHRVDVLNEILTSGN